MGGTSTVMLKPFARAASASVATVLAAAFEGDSARTSALSVRGTAPTTAFFTSSSGRAGKLEEIWLARFSNLMSSTTSVLPYLSHISGMWIVHEGLK